MKARFRICFTSTAVHYVPVVDGKPDNYSYILFKNNGDCFYRDVTGRVKFVGAFRL